MSTMPSEVFAMNTPIARPPQPSGESRRGDDAPRADNPERCSAEAAFERVLRSKSGSRERESDRDDDDTPADGAMPQPLVPNPHAMALAPTSRHAVAAV